MAVLDIQNLTLSFGERTLFAGVSFSIKEREKVGFVGANGVGKTSLFKVIWSANWRKLVIAFAAGKGIQRRILPCKTV